MGNVTHIAHSNEFWVDNLHEFRDGLKGYVGGEWDTPVRFEYSDYKRRSKNALINVTSHDFSTDLHHKDDYEQSLDLLEYIKSHIMDGSEAVIHAVSYEHPGDMRIEKYMVTNFSIENITILEN